MSDLNSSTPVYVASAFSKGNKGGNKAGVSLSGDSLSVEQKKGIATELGFSETVFISRSVKADFKLEYFTPNEEVPLCGHATIAAFYILKLLNHADKSVYLIETKSGELMIKIKDDIILMEQNKPQFYEEVPHSDLKDCFDIDCIDPDIPAQIVSTGLKDILIPIRSEKLLGELKPDLQEIEEISKKYDVVGEHIYAFDKDRIICRNFAPLYDIDEEAATGTSNCALAGFMFAKLGIKRDLYVFEQGYSLNSPSEIIVDIIDEGDEIKQIFVGGRTYFIEKLDMAIDK